MSRGVNGALQVDNDGVGRHPHRAAAEAAGLQLATGDEVVDRRPVFEAQARGCLLDGEGLGDGDAQSGAMTEWRTATSGVLHGVRSVERPRLLVAYGLHVNMSVPNASRLMLRGDVRRLASGTGGGDAGRLLSGSRMLARR